MNHSRSLVGSCRTKRQAELLKRARDAEKIVLERQAHDSGMRLIGRPAIAHFSSLPAATYRPHLELYDDKGKRLLLQRFSATTRYGRRAMVASEAAGRARFSALASILPRRHQGGSRQTEAQMKNPLYHLGALYDQTQTFFGVTRDTMARPAAAMEVVSWTHSFADQFVRSEDLHPRFRDLLQRREHEDYPWLATQYPSFAQVLHPFFTTSAIFQGFTGETHVDAADCYPSILLNFGAMAHLELPDFGVAVELQPFDIVVFDSGRVRHRTTRSPIDIAAGISETQRWAVSLFHRHRATLRQPTPARANDISRILTAPIQAGAVRRLLQLLREEGLQLDTCDCDRRLDIPQSRRSPGPRYRRRPPIRPTNVRQQALSTDNATGEQTQEEREEEEAQQHLLAFLHHVKLRSPPSARDTDTAADTDHTNTSSTSRRKRRRPD